MEFAQILTVPLYVDVIKVFLLGLFAFVLAILLAPVLTAFLYNKRFRTRVKRKTISGERAPVTKAATKGKEGTPLMGGLLVWGTVLILGGLFLLVSFLSGDDFWINFNFVSRSQTWLPMFALATTGFIGLVDDYFSCRGKGQGVKFLYRFLWLIAVALLGAWWFYFKLEYSSIHLPGLGDWEIGWWYMLYFVLVIVATAVSSNETDGLDGLNGGILLIAYGAFTFIAFFQERIDLAAFCAVICGGLLAFLWFNIYPARFFMGDTGAFSLGATLGVVALLTNSSLVLILIAFVYVVESLSVIIQLLSKRLRGGKRVFLAAPIHYHFRAIGWPESKVVMRLWIIAGVMSVIGVVVAFFGGG